ATGITCRTVSAELTEQSQRHPVITIPRCRDLRCVKTRLVGSCITSFFSTLVDFVHAHSQYTHIAIFLLALSEAIPVVGTVVPGSTLIIGISALATSANANPWLLVIAAT